MQQSPQVLRFCLLFGLLLAVASSLFAADPSEQAVAKLIAFVRERQGVFDFGLSSDGTTSAEVRFFQKYLTDAEIGQFLSLGVPLNRLDAKSLSFGPETAKALPAHMASLREIALRDGAVSTEVMQILGRCKDLEKLTLNQCQIAPAAFLEIGKLTRLQSLQLGLRKEFASAHLGFVANLERLNHLDLTTFDSSSLPEDISPLKHLRSLESLELYGLARTDEVLEALGNNRGLRTVTLLHSSDQLMTQLLTVRGLAALSRTNLQELDMGIETVDLEMAKILARIPTLRKLNMRSDHFREGAFTEVCKCPELEELILVNAQIPATELPAIAGLKSLRTLMSDSPATEEYLRAVTRCQRLESLSLRHSGITDERVKLFTQLPRLTELYLQDNDITDRSVTELEKIATLRRMGLAGTRVTDAGVKTLQKALPWLVITR